MACNGTDTFVSGGYYLTLRRKRTEWMSAELIPENLLSASRCICDLFPADWTIAWVSMDESSRSKKADRFGISPAELPVVVAWATAGLSSLFGWTSAFYRLENALEARAQLLPKEIDVVIFGLGLHSSEVDRFLEFAKPPEPQPGRAPVGETGVYECVRARVEIQPGGNRAGFELLAINHGSITCSWLCNGLESGCANELGVVPNSNGFIQTLADALRCTEYIRRDATGAEPGLWLPWLITTYPER